MFLAQHSIKQKRLIPKLTVGATMAEKVVRL
jgi:hypothetical protein